MKHGLGEERTLVGTIFEGMWERNRKHGRGVRKMVFGTVEEQVGGSCDCHMQVVNNILTSSTHNYINVMQLGGKGGIN